MNTTIPLSGGTTARNTSIYTIYSLQPPQRTECNRKCDFCLGLRWLCKCMKWCFPDNEQPIVQLSCAWSSRENHSYSMKIVNWNVYMRVPMCTNGSWAIRSAKQLCEKSGQAKPKTVRRTITSMNSFGLINRVADQLVTQVRSFVFCAKTFSGSCWNLEIIPRRWRPTASDMLFSIHMQMFKKRLTRGVNGRIEGLRPAYSQHINKKRLNLPWAYFNSQLTSMT